MIQELMRSQQEPVSTDVTAAVIEDDPQVHEDVHVHAIYEQIASHFSSTRYKPWPIIARFLSDIPTGWIGLDSGTGNGKYLPLPLERPGSLWTIGLDRSRNLLEIARKAGSSELIREVVWGDVLGDIWRNGAFDYAVSIATIHHLATYKRRKVAIQRLLECVSPKHGRLLIYVWAMEQDELSTRTMPSENEADVRADASNKTGKDVFVPWVLSQQNSSMTKSKSKSRRGFKASSPSSAIAVDETPSQVSADTNKSQVYKRYYHMFAQGELTELVSRAAREMGMRVGPQLDCGEEEGRGVEIVRDGWERSNYYVELRCWAN